MIHTPPWLDDESVTWPRGLRITLNRFSCSRYFCHFVNPSRVCPIDIQPKFYNEVNCSPNVAAILIMRLNHVNDCVCFIAHVNSLSFTYFMAVYSSAGYWTGLKDFRKYLPKHNNKLVSTWTKLIKMIMWIFFFKEGSLKNTSWYPGVPESELLWWWASIH